MKNRSLYSVLTRFGIDVQVTVKDVDEPGTITLDRLQPQVEARTSTATLTDPDQRPGLHAPQQPLPSPPVAGEWTIPKGESGLTEDNDDHWQFAVGPPSTNTTVI